MAFDMAYFEASHCFYAVATDLSGCFTYVNPLFKKRFGHLGDDFIGMPFHHTVYGQADVDIFVEAAVKLIQDPSLHLFVEVQKQGAGGKVVWQGYELTALMDAGGQPSGIFCVGYDISRSKAEQERADRAVKLTEDVLENMHDGFILLNRDRKVVNMNRAAEQLLGHAREQITGRELADLRSDPLVGQVLRRLGRLRTRHYTRYFELFHPASKKWLHTRLFLSESGIGIYFKDVTMRKRREQSLVDSEARLRAVLDSHFDEIHFLLSPSMRVWSFNKSAIQAIWQIHKVKLRKGMDFRRFILPDTEKEFEMHFNNALSGRHALYEAQITLPADVIIWFQLGFYPLFDDEEKVTGVSFNVKNIDTQKRAEQQLTQQNQQLREIAYTQSHVLRRPVSSILGLLNLLEDSTQDHDFAADLLRHLRQAGNELDEVIQRIVTETYTTELPLAAHWPGGTAT